MAELMEIIGTRLAADTDPGGVNEPDNGATAGFHNGNAPEGTGYDRVIIKQLTGLPSHTLTALYAKRKFVQFMVYTVDPVNGGETGTGKCSRLVGRIVELFDHKAEVINDPALVSVLLERDLPQETTTDSNGRDVHSEGVIFEMWTV